MSSRIEIYDGKAQLMKEIADVNRIHAKYFDRGEKPMIVCPNCGKDQHDLCVDENCECPYVLGESTDSGEITCWKCHGTGLEPEGWDCDYCDGSGVLEI